MNVSYRLKPVFTLVLKLAIILICNQSSMFAQIWVGNGDGISWGDGANWSTNSVPTSSSNAVINDATVILSDQYIVQSLSLDNASLTIAQQSGIRIRGADAIALNLTGSSEVAIEGQLRIDDFQSTGIRISDISIVDVRPSGFLRIDSEGITGVRVESGTFNNSGDAIIENILVGLYSEGLTTNDGTLLIDNVQTIGIDHRNGDFKNCTSGRIEIIGKINSNENAIGIDTRSELTNEGTIEVVSCYEASIRIHQSVLINKDSLIFRDYGMGIFGGITTGSSLVHNEASGVMYFKTSSENHITVAISSYGTVNNHGKIIMLDRTDTGIHLGRQFMTPSNSATATFNNYGIIDCFGYASSIFIFNEAIFKNHPTGEIIIGPTGEPNTAIFTNASFTNEGQIFIEWPGTSESCIASYSSSGPAYFINRGQIDLSGGSISIQMNGPGGGRSVLINDETGVLNISSAARGINLGDTLINHNVINIDNCHSIGVVVVGNLTESSFLDNRDSMFIRNTRRPMSIAGEFQNSNYLEIENGRDVGMQVERNAIFKNTSSAFSSIESDIPLVDSLGSILDIQGELILSIPN